MRNLNKSVIIMVIICMFIIIGVKYMLMAGSGGEMVEITVPTYGAQPDVYITKNYVEKNGCIEFTDGFGMKHKVCGDYSISKW
jgi:hypothetical protein